MKVTGNFILIISVLIIFSLEGCTTQRGYVLRPVALQVLDAKTEQPLRDIAVHQIIESDIYGGCFKLLPRLEPTDQHYEIETKTTNEYGMVAFSRKPLRLACSEYITHEYLIINTDLKPGVYERDLAGLSISHAGALVHFGISSLKSYQERYTATLNDQYRGYVIYGADYPMGSNWYQGKEELFDVVTNGEGLLAPSQSFVIRLEQLRK
jgi:hypothetical protein